MITVGNRIYTQIDRPDKSLVEMFRGIPSSNINDEMNRLFCMHNYMRPLNNTPLLGTAFTVKVPLGDNLLFHKALDMAQTGDVIVVDGGSGCNRSLAGEIMLRYAYQRGIAGVIVDGCLRDLDSIKEIPMAVYAKGITPQGPYKSGPGEINTPISCGGQVVFPGDILVGDGDGVVVIRPQDAKELAAAAQKKKASEDETFALMRKRIEEYTQKHVNSTEKRMEGKNIAILEKYSY